MMGPETEPVQAEWATVLIVDDEPVNLAVLSEILRPHYRVRAARSGEQALRIAASEPRPDIVLLDIMMPGTDGYSVLADLRGAPATADIPVVFVTALGAEEDESRGLALGAVDYLTKPLSAPIVLARVAAQLELKSARDRLARQNELLEQQVAERLHELQRAQEQLLQSEKMASLGILAAGLAHEINNPISYVSSNLATLADSLKELFAVLDAYRETASALAPDAPQTAALRAVCGRVDLDLLRQDLPALIAESREGIERINRIVRDLKQFSHPGTNEQWQEQDLHQILDSSLNIAWNELKYKAEVVKEYGELPPVECLPIQLNQVFVNLLVNAAQALEERGRVTLRTGTEGGRAWIEVEDTGAGIAPENLNRVFDPLFTTKPVGKGTGLGLSVSYNIVKQHGGVILVRSAAGEGATFRVELPVQRAAGGGVGAAVGKIWQ